MVVQLLLLVNFAIVVNCQSTISDKNDATYEHEQCEDMKFDAGSIRLQLMNLQQSVLSIESQAIHEMKSEIEEILQLLNLQQAAVRNETQARQDLKTGIDEMRETMAQQLYGSKNASYINTCRKIKASNPHAPSGKYIIIPSSKNPVEVYCEMGLNGGGYTFLSPVALSKLSRLDLAEMFTDRSTFLMRIRRTDGTQPYAVLSQLPKYSGIPLKLGLSENTGYNAPVNIRNLGSPFLYFGFLPIVNGSNLDVQGLVMNGLPITFRNCDRNPNGHITIFPDFLESVPSTYRVVGPIYGPIFSNVRPNPSGRVMPPEYFMFAESHWGGCGCYVQTNQVPGVLGLAIGFK